MSSFVSAIELPLPRLAEIFAASFAGYFVPISAEVTAFATRVRNEHVDLAASLVAFDGDVPTGIALIARRGTLVRIAAMGAVPAARNRGLGRALLDVAFADARARGEQRMVLEVIEQNAAARALYSRAGFTVARRLVGFRAPPLGRVGAIASLAARSIDDFVRAYLSGADPALPWQIAPATIAAATPPLQAFALGPALALVDVQPTTVVLRAVVVSPDARREGHATRLVSALRGHFAERALRVVPIVPEHLLGKLPPLIGAELDDLAQLELIRQLR